MVPDKNAQIVSDILQRYSTVLLLEKDGRIAHRAMGFRLAIGQHRFLITCKHVVEPVVKNGAGLWIPVGTTCIPLTNVFLFPKDQRMDVAVGRLPDDWDLGNCEYLRLTDLCSSFQPNGISCFTGGVLCCESREWHVNQNPDASVLRWANVVSRTTSVENDSMSFDDQFHFGFGGDVLQTTDTVRNTTRPNPVSFEGISGAPVFAVNENPFMEGWIPTDFKVIGVQSSRITRPGCTIYRAVRIESIVSIITSHFPDTAKLIRDLEKLELPVQLISKQFNPKQKISPP